MNMPAETPSRYETCCRLAERLADAGQLEDALAEVESFVAVHPTYADAWNDIAVLQHALTRPLPALLAAGIAVDIDGQNPLYRHTRASLLLAAGDAREAAQVLAPVLARPPIGWAALVLAGDIALAQRRPAAAHRLWQQAIAADPAGSAAAERLASSATMPRGWQDFVGPADLVFDVGANIGDKTAAYLAIGARVVAVEPQPTCLAHLAARFAGDPRVAVVGQGLAAAPGRGELSICQEAATISTMSEAWKTGRFAAHRWDARVSIELSTLDALIATHGLPRYCKIDVEGYELEVLRGLSQPVPLLAFEYTIEFAAVAAQCLAHLRGLGYTKFNLTVGEAPHFRCAGWVSADEIVAYIKGSAQPDLWGDVYAHVED